MDGWAMTALAPTGDQTVQACPWYITSSAHLKFDSGILSSLKKEENPIICNDMDKPEDLL